VLFSVKGSGSRTISNEQGQFILGTVPPGEYTLVAHVPDKKPQERTVAVPARDGNYDISI